MDEFNKTYRFFPDSTMAIPAYGKISPKSLIEAMCNIVNQRGGPSLALTPTSIFFLLDMVIELRSQLKFRISDEMKSVEGDSAYEHFRRVKDENVSILCRVFGHATTLIRR